MKYTTSVVRRTLPLLLMFAGLAGQAQTGDVTGISIRLVEHDPSTIEIQLRPNSNWNYEDGVLNPTFAIRWATAEGGLLGNPLQPDPCFSSGAPLGANPGHNNVDSDGYRYKGFSGGGQAFPAECSFAANVWVTYARVPVTGITGCPTFQIVTSDAYTAANNTDYFLSLGGFNITASSPIVGQGVQLGSCGMEDCLGVVGGTALPGTPCNDGDPCTVNDTWTQGCVCMGTPVSAPQITNTTSNSPVCAGEALSLGVTASTAVGSITYTWTGTGTFSPNATSANVTVTGAATGNYVVTADNGCATSQSTVAVVVNPVPAAPDPGSYGPLCSGDPAITLAGSPAGGAWSGTGVSGTGAGPYTFSPASGTQTLEYTITSNGCSNSATTVITVNTTPAAPVPGSYGPLCSTAGPIALQGAPTGGIWTGTGVSANAPYTFSPSAGTQLLTYTVTGNGCSSEATTTVVVGGCDCAEVVNGTAFIDGCGQCVGGNTGLEACDEDCAGVAGGSASFDQCEVCSGGTTGIVPNSTCTDCADVINGNAQLDACGVCSGGTTGIEPNSTCADCEGVPNGPALVGTTCDDGDADTTGDVWLEGCICAGTPVLENDCLGIAGGSAQPGTSCDAGPEFDGGIWNEDCECIGTPVDAEDCLGVIGGSAQPGTTCDAGPGFVGGIWNEDCECIGTPVDQEDCLGVIGGSALPGTPCDDSNEATIDDTWSAGCECIGTPIGDPDHTLILELQTDAAPGQTSWVIHVEGNESAIMCQGGGYDQEEAIVTATCDLPDGCFVLRVYDSAGDGMTTAATGGYILRMTGMNGARIIDNRYNFTNGGESAIAGGQGFCLPMGTGRPIYTSCDKLDWLDNQFIVASLDPAVSDQWINGQPFTSQSTITGYEFWFFDPNGTYSHRVFKSLANSSGIGSTYARAAHLLLNSWASANHIPHHMLLNVRVRSVVMGEAQEWGPACRFKIDPVAAQCPVTKLMDIPGNQYLSCGQWRQWATNQAVHARPVQGASQYQFRFRQENFEVIRTASSYFVRLGWTNAPILEEGTQYEVDVRAMKNGEWCEWGDVCILNIGVPLPGGAGTNSMAIEAEEVAAFNMWPNPNRGDQLYLSLDVPTGIDRIAIDMFDMSGRRVTGRIIPANEGGFSTVLDLGGELGGGMYVVNIAAGERTYTQRLVVQP
jgi:hypothetical protein